ncbi:MAG: class I SAM-dependent methyltransferase [Proteobacteria bacterium]|nr:class I SAM-dependent methyltransferase [Pseudomonadota bacterium]
MGTGDGSYVIKCARDNADKFFIGIDAAAENLSHNSQKAAKKPQKGGLPNVLFVHANVETLPQELNGVATEITINLPWGSLLKAVATPDLAILKGIAKLCKTGANLRVIFGYDLANEKKTIEELGLPLITSAYLDNTLTCAYREAGFDITWCYLSQDELKQLPTAWAKKLAYGKERQFIQIQGKYVGE